MQDIISEKLILRFASLLHDIGKFWQGAGENGKHEELSARFVKQYLPEDLEKASSLINLHHDYEKYTGEEYKPLKILVLADWLASSERVELEEKEERGKRKKTPMESIFANINLSDRIINEKREKYYTIRLLDGKLDLLPEKRELLPKDLTESYKKLWDNFLEELNKLKYPNPEIYFITLYYLLKKYTSFIPSAIWQSKPDISLFDHSRITCAIAECIYEEGKERLQLGKILEILNKNIRKEKLEPNERNLLKEKMFSLIGGDISGIQKFIYSITSKGAAKGLKGRSIYLQLLSDAIAEYILREMNLSIANLIYSAGGHFYILAPANVNTEELSKKLEEILMEIHNGELYVAIDKVDLSIEDLIEKNIGEKWKELGDKLEGRKKRKFSNILSKDFFYPKEDSKGICQVCGLPSRYDLIEEDGISKCRLCDSFEKLSEKIARKGRIKAKYIVECEPDKTEEENTWEGNISKFGIKYELLENIQKIKCNKGMIFIINNKDFIIDGNKPFSYGFRFLFQTPLMELNELSKNAKGIKRWGVIRGDVDNLGRIFSEGLKKEDRTLSRISTLSSLMSFFFDAHINNICQKEEFKDKIYGIYAGGDDFFIIGSWDILPDLAYTIYNEFKKYTANNPDITLSIGIAIAPSDKYPIYKIADVAGDELEKAKHIKDYVKSKKIERDKDAISFLGFPIKWDEYPKLVGFRDELYNFIENAPKGSLQKFYSIYLMYERARKKVGSELAIYDNRYGRWRWILSYLTARMKVKDKEKIKQLLIENIDYSPVVIKWVEYLTRGDKNG